MKRMMVDEMGQLECPRCGPFSCTHNTGVEVYVRADDAAVGTKVEVMPPGGLVGLAGIDNDAEVEVTVRSGPLPGNPSGRRGAVVLHFVCEGCWGRFTVEFAQHKGSTLVRTVPGVVVPEAEEFGGEDE